MAKELYVGSLSYDTTEYELEKLFSVSGRVTSLHLITDTKTGRFMGCGYVRMSTEAEAKDAIATLDGALFLEKRITVSIANPQKQKNQAGGYKGKAGGPSKGGAKASGAPKAGGKAKTSGAPKAGGSTARPSAGAKPAGKAVAAKPGAPKSAAKPAAKPAASRAATKPAPKKG